MSAVNTSAMLSHQQQQVNKAGMSTFNILAVNNFNMPMHQKHQDANTLTITMTNRSSGDNDNKQ